MMMKGSLPRTASNLTVSSESLRSSLTALQLKPQQQSLKSRSASVETLVNPEEEPSSRLYLPVELWTVILETAFSTTAKGLHARLLNRKFKALSNLVLKKEVTGQVNALKKTVDLAKEDLVAMETVKNPQLGTKSC